MSDRDAFAERERALEESFFARRNQELLEQMRSQLAVDEQRAAMAAASGVRDNAVLDELIAAQITPETVAAFTLVPLVAVAWADRSVQQKEREAVLQAAEQHGLQSPDPGYLLLERWLDELPPPLLMQTWKDYAQALSRSLGEPALARIRADVLGRARSVAEAAGGLLGRGKVSAAEQKVLDELDAALRPSNAAPE